VNGIGRRRYSGNGSIRPGNGQDHKIRCPSGSIYIILTVFLIIMIMILSLLIFALRIVILAHDIDHAFERCGADLLTAIRKENYDAVTESNMDYIEQRINDPSDPSAREHLKREFVSDLAESLRCSLDPDRQAIRKEAVSSDAPAFTISDFKFAYENDTGSVIATLEIPIVIFGNTIQVYVKELMYEFALAEK